MEFLVLLVGVLGEVVVLLLVHRVEELLVLLLAAGLLLEVLFVQLGAFFALVVVNWNC